MGNSEVGHLTIGSGRDPLPGPDAREQGGRDRRALRERGARSAFERGENVHLLGLVSHGGVHSHIDHVQALLKFAPEKTWIHAFTDGRDVSPHSAVARPRGAADGPDRDRRRPLLRDGPRQALGSHRARARRDREGRGRARRRPDRRGAGELRPRRHRRVHRADRARRPPAPRPGDGHRDLLQLPPRPRRGSCRRSSASSAST